VLELVELLVELAELALDALLDEDAEEVLVETLPLDEEVEVTLPLEVEVELPPLLVLLEPPLEVEAVKKALPLEPPKKPPEKKPPPKPPLLPGAMTTGAIGAPPETISIGAGAGIGAGRA
jgi:hypothetical protein